jgi:uncharacterized NAD(P)/FAD-binding protein YdhS
MENGLMRVAIVGGGPSALFIYKKLLETGLQWNVTIFEKGGRLGAGMPYSESGSNSEHITNVSANEIPDLPISFSEWFRKQTPYAFDGIENPSRTYNPYKVIPRLLFGEYLESQFSYLLKLGEAQGIKNLVRFNTTVTDVANFEYESIIKTSESKSYTFDKVILSTGHQFPTGLDEVSTGYFQSPYPPRKLSNVFNHAVAVRGASLTAVDAVRTLARANGNFVMDENGSIKYSPRKESSDFKIVLHCRSGMLPAVRFHLADSRLKNPSLLTDEEIETHRRGNGGFLSLDYIFEKDFKEPLKNSDPDFYHVIQDLSMEEFVALMLSERAEDDPFTVLRAECEEAQHSIREKKSICWKEMLGVLSFALNYPAKYFSAEDMLRYKATLHPLIGLVIAYVPQSSCSELLALHEAGCLEMQQVGPESEVVRKGDRGITYSYNDSVGNLMNVKYKTFVDCTGQPHIDFKDFPFQSLVARGTVTQASLKFQHPERASEFMAENPSKVVSDKSGEPYLKVPGVAVNDHFQVIGTDGRANTDIFMMAVPCMGGYNPDYSGLDFAEEASKRIVDRIMHEVTQNTKMPVINSNLQVA